MKTEEEEEEETAEPREKNVSSRVGRGREEESEMWSRQVRWKIPLVGEGNRKRKEF